jgi:hypothetical protein
MVRKPTSPSSPAGTPGGASNPPRPEDGGGKSERERIVAAFMAILAEKPIEQVGFAEIAQRAGVSLAELRGNFNSTLGILAAQMKDIDRKVLSGGDPDMARAFPGAFGGPQSRTCPRAQWAGGALAAMDADGGRYLGIGAARHGAFARSGAAVCFGSAHLAE